jgi:multidrug efflux pump subunit AcrB
MKLPKIAIENHYFTIVVFLMLLLVGVSAFINMPRTEDPPITIPGASIIIVYPGANPVDLEELIASPLESALNELDDIKVMETTIKDGLVVTSIEFLFSTNAEDKYDEILRQINNIRNDLPDDIYQLKVEKWASSDVVILHLALTSENAPFYQMEEEAENLKDDIEKVVGVRKVEILAYPEQEVRISLDMEKMAVMNISLEDISNSILSNNINIPGGSVDIGSKSFNIKTSGSYSNLNEIKNTVVGSHMGQIVYLKSIANISFEYEDEKYYGRYNGKRALFLTIQQKEGVNIFDTKEGIDQVLDKHRTLLDDTMKLEIIFDQSESVDERINGFMLNLFQGILLVGVVILLALGFRASIMVIVAIPFSIFIGMALNDVSNIGLQQMSIAGLVIALGLLVDNSIVIVENIKRYIGLGYNQKEAAVEGTRQLAWPIVSATATTMLAFIPIIAMPDKSGAFIRTMPITVVYTLAASLFIALTLTPFLSSIVLKRKTKEIQSWFSKQLKSLIQGPYRSTLLFAIKNKVLVLSLSILMLIGSGLLFQFVGVSFFPKAEKPQFLIRINLPQGSNIDKTDQVASYVETVLDTIPEVSYYATNVGHGNPRIYYNIFVKNYTSDYAEIFVQLQEYEFQAFNDFIKRLRKTFSNYPGAKIEVKEFEQGPPVEAPLAIKVTGQNLEKLREISKEIESFVKQTPGAINVDNQLSKTNIDLRFIINRDKAMIFGVPIHEIDRTIRTAINGIGISKFRDSDGKEYNIVLRLPVGNNPKPSDFDKIYVSSVSGKQIPVKQFASVVLEEAPGVIPHYNMDRNSTITADIDPATTLDDVVAKLQPKLDNFQWPEGYNYKYAGELQSREESFGGMARASIIAIIAIFAVLVLQFKSLTQPLIIYSAIPFAIIGSVLALFLLGYTFSFTAFIGLISLIGIVINNSIIMVDYTNELRANGISMDDALQKAGETRFTPIVLTMLTTVGGLLPLTLRGGTMWAPMGWTIIGGLLFSTMLTLIIVPVLYKLMTPEKVRN